MCTFSKATVWKQVSGGGWNDRNFRADVWGNQFYSTDFSSFTNFSILKDHVFSMLLLLHISGKIFHAHVPLYFHGRGSGQYGEGRQKENTFSQTGHTCMHHPIEKMWNHVLLLIHLLKNEAYPIFISLNVSHDKTWQSTFLTTLLLCNLNNQNKSALVNHLSSPPEWKNFHNKNIFIVKSW